MKIKYLLVGMCLLFLSTMNAQGKRTNNNIYLELAGNAGVYSLNYDRVVYNNFSVRAGIMLLPSISKLFTAVPLIMNYRFHIGDNYIETGLGVTIFSLPADFGFLGEKTLKAKILTGVISYCYKSKSGINSRISFTPFYYNQKLFPFGGFSIGYSF